MKRLIIFMLGAAALLTGCSNDATDTPQINNYPADGVVRIATRLDAMPMRASETPYAGADLSLSVNYPTAGIFTQNVKWTNTSDAWTPETQMLWKDATTPAVVRAFAPYVEGMTTFNEVFNFSVATDQSAGLTASDLVGYVDKAFVPGSSLTAKNELNIAFTHQLAKLSVELTFGDQWGGQNPAVTSVTIGNVRFGVSYDSTVPRATDNGATESATTDIITYKNTADADMTRYEAIVAPQTVASGVRLVTVKLSNGESYGYTITATAGHTFAVNTQTTIKLRIGKDAVTLASPLQVSNWTTGEQLPNGEADEVLPYYETTLAEFSAFTAEDYDEWIITGPRPTTIDEFATFSMAMLARTTPLKLTISDVSVFNDAFTGVFRECPQLKELSLPKATELTNYLFDGCTALTTLWLGTETDTPITVGSYAFEGLSTMNVTLHLNASETVTNGSTWHDRTFAAINPYVASYATFDATAAAAYDSWQITGQGTDEQQEALKTAVKARTTPVALSLPDATSLINEAFRSSKQLASVSLPEVTTLGGTETFVGGDVLTSAYLPKVTELTEYTFWSCPMLSEVDLSALKVLGRGSLMSTGLTSIDLPNVEEVGEEALAFNQTTLTSVRLPKATKIGLGAFQFDRKLESVSLPAAQTIGADAFREVSALTSISLPEVTEVGYTAFRYCNALEEVWLPKVQTLSYRVFATTYSKQILTVHLGTATTTPMTVDANLFKDSVPADITLYLSKYETVDNLTWNGWTFKAINIE